MKLTTRPNVRFAVGIALSLALLATACSDPDQTEPAGPDPDSPATSTAAPNGGQAGQSGSETTVIRQAGGPGPTDPDTEITLTLSQPGAPEPGEFDRVPLGEADAMDPADSAALLDRVEGLEPTEGDRADFYRPPESQPRPRGLATVDAQFPPPSEPDGPPGLAADEPLQVLRYQPEGEIELAPFIAVTFNQPMVALGTVDSVEAQPVPITIEPEIPGRWVWLGTETARFEHDSDVVDRIPAATEFRVSVAAGAESVGGAALSEGVEWTFSTPAPIATDAGPMNDSMPTDAMWLVEFNVMVDPETALDSIAVTAGGESFDVRLVEGESALENSYIAHRVDKLLKDRWIVVTPTEPLPLDAAVELTVGPGLGSTEGPVLSDSAQSFVGRTYGEFELTQSGCSWTDDEPCTPGEPMYLRFSNPIDVEAFRADQVTVDPAMPGMTISVSSDRIMVQGRTAGRTTYSVTAAGSLVDTFGQALGEAATAEIRSGDAPAAVLRPGRDLVTLDPITADQTLQITTMNQDQIHVTVYQVSPADWVEYERERWDPDNAEWSSRWTVLDERTIETGAEPNVYTEVPVVLSDQLGDGGHVVVAVSPGTRSDQAWRNEPFAIWVQSTMVGVDVSWDNGDALAWVTDLRTGEPIQGATVRIADRSGETDRDGMVTLELAPDGGPEQRTVLATVDADTALLVDFWGSSHDPEPQARWYGVTDRGIYRPGETVSHKGWIRLADYDLPADLSIPDGGQVSWSARDSFGNPLASGQAPLNALGGYDLNFEVPEGASLGPAGLELSLRGAGRNEWHQWFQFEVQEFRRPDFEVVTTVESTEPHMVDQAVRVSATGSYFAGGRLPGADIDWHVTARQASYSPPKWSDFTFGIWTPWWWHFGEGFPALGEPTTAELSGVTDHSGSHALAIDIDLDGKPQPIAVEATGTVFDVTRQAFSSTASTLVHPGDLYVGLRTSGTFTQPGEPIQIDGIVTDLDGAPAEGIDLVISSERLEWRFEAGEWTEVGVAGDTCELVSGSEPVTCTLNPGAGGRHRITATVADSSGRQNLTEITRWVAGEKRPPNRRVELDQVDLVPQREEWLPGETAEILVQAPFADAHGQLVLTRNAITHHEAISFDETGAATVRIPVTEDDIGGFGVQVEAVGTAPRGPDLVRPAFATGSLTLQVPADGRRLQIDVAPRADRLIPGSSTALDIAVRDQAGDPVADAELLVMVVDEAVLALTGYELSDPIETWYERHGGYLSTARGRASVLLGDPGSIGAGSDLETVEESAVSDDSFGSESMDMMTEAEMAMDGDAAAAPMMRSMTAGAAAEENGAPEAIEVRTDFSALAMFEPEVRTDGGGRATVDLDLPDSLTRYRVMVVAAAGSVEAGTGQSNVTAQLPVSVRPTPPRFANFGDRFGFPVVVQNNGDTSVQVDVAIEATNLTIDGPVGKTVTVPAADRVEVRFDMVTDVAGTARYQVAATTGEASDAAEGSFPVYTPATAEAFASYGVIDSGGISQPLVPPADVFPQFGGLEVSTSSTAVSALTDAVIDVSDYRHDSGPALAARIAAIASLGDLLAAFDSEGVPEPGELRAKAQRDITELLRLQGNDGGFTYWRPGRRSDPWVSTQATHALVIAAQSGFDVDAEALRQAIGFVERIENHPSLTSDSQTDNTRTAIIAYALHIRELFGEPDLARAESLWRESDEPPVDVAAWLWTTLANTATGDEIDRFIHNRVTETANAATFATEYGEQGWVILHSDRRTDAIVLNSLLTERPDSDLILKTLNGILAGRDRSGRFGNIVESAYVLIAVGEYFERFERQAPDFVGQTWIGDTYAAEHTLAGRNVNQLSTLIPMDVLTDQDATTDIAMVKDGDGRLYYRLGLRYSPADLKLEPRDQGFVVERNFEPVDDDGDVVTDAAGNVTVKAGARVRVRLSMVADSRRTHVGLIDPMPAGFEAINPALAVSEPIPPYESSDGVEGPVPLWRSWWRWYDHQNLRDDRAEAFATWLGAGVYEYSYVARATTVGTFQVPPTRAEQLYEPEVFGRSSNTVVTIVD